MGWKDLQSHNQCTICRFCYPLKEYFEPPCVYRPHSLPMCVNLIHTFNLAQKLVLKCFLVEYQKDIAFTEVSDHYRVILILFSVRRATSEKEYFYNLLHRISLNLLMFVSFTHSNVRQILNDRIFS